jgi:glucose-6-phosphate isomerase
LKLRRNKLEPLRFDPFGSYVEKYGVSKSEVFALAKELEPVRDSMIGMALDTGFYTRPHRLLSEYENDRRGSELGRLFRVATHMHTIVDRMVVVGDSGSFIGARALMEGCCQPYWNELTRGARGSKPRLYFASNPSDNDAMQGLLHLLGANEGRHASNETDRWGLVVVSKCGETLETATAFHSFLAALERSCGGDRARIGELLVAVTGDGKPDSMAAELGCREIFAMPEDVGEPCSVLSAAGLVPAAMLGINVIELLQGAVAMNEHFEKNPAEENIVLQFVAVNHLLAKQREINIRVIRLWNDALRSLGEWYEQLSAVSFDKHDLRLRPLTVVQPRDNSSQSRQHRPGDHNQVIHNILVDGYRFDELAIGRPANHQDSRDAISEVTLPEIYRATVAATNEAMASNGCPTTSLSMPRVDELHLGQLLQMLMIATAVESKMTG